MDKTQLLKLFFTKLHDIVLREEKRLYNKSVLLTLAKMNSNKASKLLNDSSILMSSENRPLFKQLLDENLIRIGDTTPTEYILSAAGIWEYEKRFNGLSENDLVDFIQRKNFSSISPDKGVSDKDKVVLFSLLGVRNFSLGTAMDLNDERTRDHWLEILAYVYDYLLQHRYIKADKSLFTKHGHDHPVAYLMVRVNDLPKATQHIFNYGKARQYYLDVAEAEEISIEKLKIILRLIFGKFTQLSEMESALNALSYLADEKSKFVRENFIYIDSSTSLKIKDALHSFFIDEE